MPRGYACLGAHARGHACRGCGMHAQGVCVCLGVGICMPRGGGHACPGGMCTWGACMPHMPLPPVDRQTPVKT